jgi:hypothetical protein
VRGYAPAVCYITESKKKGRESLMFSVAGQSCAPSPLDILPPPTPPSLSFSSRTGSRNSSMI